MALAAAVMLIGLGASSQLFTVAQDQEFATVAGLNVRAYNLLLAVLAAVTVTVAMRTVGLLLVSALMIVPVAATQQLTRSFRSTLYGAMGVGLFSSVGGLLIAAWASFRVPGISPGPTIVLLSLSCFVMTWPIGAWLRHRRRQRLPFDEMPPLAHHTTGEHPHRHGENCGHPAVPHGDHVDYLHDGHRHAAHGEHYDEH